MKSYNVNLLFSFFGWFVIVIFLYFSRIDVKFLVSLLFFPLFLIILNQLDIINLLKGGSK